MLKTWRIVTCTSIVLSLTICCLLLFRKEPVKTVDTTEYVERIDSLNRQLKTLQERRDSIVVRIDTVYREIEKIKVVYEKSRITILNNSDDDNLIFFREYLERNRARRDSIDNLY